MTTLRSVDYPADRDDILRAARADGLDEATLRLITTSLNGRSYNGVYDVVSAIEGRGSSTGIPR